MSTEENTIHESQLATRPKRELRIVEDASMPVLDTARFDQIVRIAAMMASATLIPDHLWKDKSGPLDPQQVKGNCFLIANQAVQWDMNPFTVMPETYVVGGKLGFQGKLIAAVVNARAGLKRRLNYAFEGTGDNLTVIVSGTMKDEDEPRTVKVRLGDAKTDNKMWRTDPEQKLIYTGATKWARRHCPEIILGVSIVEEAEHIENGNRLKPRAFSLEAPEESETSIRETLVGLMQSSGISEKQVAAYSGLANLADISDVACAALVENWAYHVNDIIKMGVLE